MKESPSTTPKLTPEEMAELNRQRKYEDEKASILFSAYSRLAPEYQVYCDKMAEEGKGMSDERKEKFLEFVAELNSRYLEFLNFLAEGDIDPEDFDKLNQEYQRKLEFFQNNFSLPLSDQEAVEALIFLQKDKPEVAKAKVRAWRELARTSFSYTDPKNPDQDSIKKPLIYLSRKGFDIKQKAPQVQDQHNTREDEDKEKEPKFLCSDNWKIVKDWDFKDIPTQDEIRYFIPRSIPESTNLKFREQRNLIRELARKIRKNHKETKNIKISIGHANQIASQILSHYNQTGERIPLNLNWVRTLTRSSDGVRLALGPFGDRGLGCGWPWDGGGGPGTSVFALGVEKLK